MERGAVVLVALPGDFGKPRPAVIVQSSLAGNLDSTIICPITSHEEDLSQVRPRCTPSDQNGLHKTSYVMVEKITAVKTKRVEHRIGTLEPEIMAVVSSRLALLLGLA